MHLVFGLFFFLVFLFYMCFCIIENIYIYIYIYIYIFINNSNNSITAYINIFCNPKLLLIDLILILEAFCSNPAQCIFFAAFILVSSSCFSEKLRHFQKFYYSSSCLNLTQQLEKFSPLSRKCSCFTNVQIASMI